MAANGISTPPDPDDELQRIKAERAALDAREAAVEANRRQKRLDAFQALLEAWKAPDDATGIDFRTGEFIVAPKATSKTNRTGAAGNLSRLDAVRGEAFYMKRHGHKYELQVSQDRVLTVIGLQGGPRTLEAKETPSVALNLVAKDAADRVGEEAPKPSYKGYDEWKDKDGKPLGERAPVVS